MIKFFYNFRPNEEIIFDDGDFANFCVYHGYAQITMQAVDHWFKVLSSKGMNHWTFNPALINFLDENDKSVDVIVKIGKEEVSFRRIPQILKKLSALGLGEALCDTDLTKIQNEDLYII